MSRSRSARSGRMRSTWPAASNPRPASRMRKKCVVSSKRSDVAVATPLESIDGTSIDYGAWPDAHGRFGTYGGIYVAETLIAPLQELTAAYTRLRKDPEFVAELDRDLKHYVGRPSPIYYAERLTSHVGGAKILLKREDMNHHRAHK